MLILGCLKNLKNHCFYLPFSFSTCTLTAVLIDWLQVALMCTMFFDELLRDRYNIENVAWKIDRGRKGEKGGDQGSKRERDREREIARNTVMGWETILLCSVLYFVYSKSPHIWHVPCSILRFTKFSLSFLLTAWIREGLRGGHTLRQQNIEMEEIEKNHLSAPP